MNREPVTLTRRSWLLGTLAFTAFGAADPDHPELDPIRTRGKQAGMEPFDESESAHFLAIGDAGSRFRQEALAVCESVLTDYRKYFKDKGFTLNDPKGKLVVVTLGGPKSYAMFEGEMIGDTVGGHFDLKENRLVMFDYRGIGANPKAPVAEQDNTFVLVHETIHQLTFNTGLLELESDVPLVIAEGLATIGETWAPKRKGVFGTTNKRRLLGLQGARKSGETWIPIAKLFAEDKLLSEAATEKENQTAQLAYAESWMLMNKLLKDHARLIQFRAYLAALREKPDPSKRMEVATTHFGDIDKLDREVRSGR